MVRSLVLPLLVLASSTALPAQIQIRLNPKTSQAFDDYAKTIEAQLDGRARFAGLKPGQIEIAPARGKGAAEVPEGIVHDWIAAIVVPGATAEKALALLQNYPNYKNVYSPDISDSKLLRREGDLFHISLRMVKKNVLTVILNGNFDVQYRSLGGGRWALTSRSSRIAEVEGEREMEPGYGHGFLWRLNAYWLVEPRPEGVHLECRTISLSRDIPFGLSLVVKPFLTSVPRESLQETLEATVRALR